MGTRLYFDIINSGTSTVPLTELTLRYRFRGEWDTSEKTLGCDWGAGPRSATARDFVLAAVPTSVTVAQGGTATSALSVTDLD